MKANEVIDDSSRTTPRRTEALWTSQDVADFLQVSLRWVEKQRALSVLPCLPAARAPPRPL